MPAIRSGTVLIATAVIEPTVSAKPTPRASIGAMNRVQSMSWTSKVEHQTPLTAISEKPTVRTQRGETFRIRCETSSPARTPAPG